MSFEVVNPDAWGRPSGWNHGMLGPTNGRVLFVAGQTAADASGAVSPAPFPEQWDRALARVIAVVRAAGGAPEHVGRLTVYVTDLEAISRLDLHRLERVGAVHASPVAAAEVADEIPVAAAGDLRVVLGDGAIGNVDGVAGRTADAVTRTVEGPDLESLGHVA